MFGKYLCKSHEHSYTVIRLLHLEAFNGKTMEKHSQENVNIISFNSMSYERK